MILSLSIFVLSLTECQGHGGPIVSTPSGRIQGHLKTSFNNRTFSAFEGIPYAKPPIAERRFEAPEPVEEWAGIWDATFVYGCPEVRTFNQKFETPGNEDCLYLNVYVPRQSPNPDEKLDVIVHIHGGAFMFGHGHEYAHPDYLMDRDVVFVTFNYRLGVFGFLSTEDDVVPGNNGMKDQVLALKWVQRNIASFGGDPKSVTLSGASAGAGAVHLHYLSPLSEGLFHKGLSHSGSALNFWAIRRGALARAKFLASNVGCPSDNSSVLVKCLKERTQKQILDKVKLLYQYKFHPIVLFGPVVEKGPKPFLNQEPYHLMTTRQVRDVPWIISTVPHEGETILSDLKDNIEDLNTKWDQIAPVIFEYNSACKNVSNQIRDFYLEQNQNFCEANFDKLFKIATDRFFVDGAEKSVTLQAAATNSSVYYYQLCYTGDSKTIVGHADDNQYFYYDKNGRSPTKNELKMKDVMVDMLVSYAKTGKPTVDGVVWEPVKPDQLNFLNISGPQPDDIKLQTGRDLGCGSFWTSLGFSENGRLD